MHRVRMLIHFGITPYLVFDGDYLPSKAGTEKERAERRRESKKLGLELLKLGKTSQAHLELQKAVDVTPEMARQVIEELKFHGIQYVVAPYEADSQLAYLERRGIIQGILSEDSDLLVFGAKCLITKLDKYGECVEINRNLFTACREVSLAGWSDAEFRWMAMLSGCDYLPSIGKMGLKTAHRMLRKHKTVERVIRAAHFDSQFKVPQGYLEGFKQAERTFLYQWVFCPIANGLVNLTAPDSGVDVATMPYIGSFVPADIAVGVANGNLNPHTKEPMVVEAVDRKHTKPLKPARRVASVHTPDLKQQKPVDAFFKPKRTPLAELDPNSFAHSPSQQALMDQQRNSPGWAAVLAPPTPASQPLQRSYISNPAPAQPRRRATDYLIRQSAPHQIKRQRLCSEGSFETPSSRNATGERSHFFPSSVPEPSPSLHRGLNSKKKRTKSFELYSDDSFDEAIATLADLEESAHKSKKKITIFQDDAEQSCVGDESQISVHSRNTTATSQETSADGALTPATSIGSPLPETEETVFSKALTSKVKDLRAKFAYGTVGSAEAQGDAAPASSPSSFPPKKKVSDKRKRQSLGLSGRTTTTERAVTKVVEGRATSLVLSTEISTKEGRGHEGIHDEAWAAMEAEVVVAASSDVEVSPSKPRYANMFDGIAGKGSEDLLVPDSEGESDSNTEAKTVRPLVDFSRFAFSG